MLLRVWWTETKVSSRTGGFIPWEDVTTVKTSYTGISLGAHGFHDSLVVRTDAGKLMTVDLSDITKTEWVKTPSIYKGKPRKN